MTILIPVTSLAYKTAMCGGNVAGEINKHANQIAQNISRKRWSLTAEDYFTNSTQQQHLTNGDGKSLSAEAKQKHANQSL